MYIYIYVYFLYTNGDDLQKSMDISEACGILCLMSGPWLRSAIFGRSWSMEKSTGSSGHLNQTSTLRAVPPGPENLLVDDQRAAMTHLNPAGLNLPIPSRVLRCNL